jgi:hypothetical protein
MNKIKKEFNKNLRNRYFINPYFQTEFLKFCLFNSVLIVTFLFFANTLFFYKAHEIGLGYGFPENHPYFDIVNRLQILMNLVTAGVAIVSSLILVFTGIRFSHKVAGPIHNLIEYFKNINNQCPQRKIQFRKTDFFRDLSEAINQYFESKGMVSKESCDIDNNSLKNQS